MPHRHKHLGRYEIIGPLGRGSSGIVHLASSGFPRQFCAIKLFFEELVRSPGALDALYASVQRWIDIPPHPHIISARSLETADDQIFLVMDAVLPDRDGCISLANHLCTKRYPFELRDIIAWIIQFCDAMDFASRYGLHSHRDIKPSNILIDTNRSLKLADLGLAVGTRTGHEPNRERLKPSQVVDLQAGRCALMADDRTITATPGYVPPEIYRGEEATVQSDVYSFGLVIWQMVTGSILPPFVDKFCDDSELELERTYRKQMSKAVPSTHGPLKPIIDLCLAADPAQRFNRFSEIRIMIEDLDLCEYQGN